MIELDLGHRRTRTPHVARWRVHQQILTRAVKPILAGDVCGLEEGVPGELVDVVIALTIGVGH